MDTRKEIKVGLIGVLVLLLLTGCASILNAPLLETPGSYGKKVTIQDLVNNWDAYTIYYAGLFQDTPAALMFDPKGDSKTLEGKKWNRVKDKETLIGMVSFIKNYVNYNPRLYSVVGPDHVVYGYIFSPTKVYMKVLNANTIYVYNVESPLYKGPGGGERGEPHPSMH